LIEAIDEDGTMKKSEIFTQVVKKIRDYRMRNFCRILFVIGICIVFSNAQTLQAQANKLTLHYSNVNAFGFPVVVSSVTVTDGNQTFVDGLTENDFTVREDDILQQPITVEAFKSDSGGVSVVLLMDISSSMGEELPDAKRAAITLVHLLTPRDRCALVSFDKNINVSQDFTSDKARLKNAINALKNGKGSAVYDAVITGVNLAQTQPGKKAIVLLTDGRDGGSKAQLDEVKTLLKNAKIPVFAIGLGVNPDRGEPELRAIAQASRGIFLHAPSTKELEGIYRNIAFIINTSYYRITYTTSSCATDGVVRLVQIEARHNGVAATDTNSYRAPYAFSRISATTSEAPAPTKTFTLNIGAPPVNNFLSNLSEIDFRLQYKTRYLDVQTPVEENISAGAAFGHSTEHSLFYSVDDGIGTITIQIKRKNFPSTGTNDGVIAQITFIADYSLPDSTALEFRIDAIKAKSAGGCDMIFEPQAATIYSDGLVVWPGDTNANGRVELADVLVLGQFWELNGPSRPGAENQLAWMPHLAKKFPIKTATHADADGGGHISERDLIPIGLNWGKSVSDITSNVIPKVRFALPEGILHARIEKAQNGHDHLKVFVERSNISPLAGVSLRIYYPAELVSFESAKSGALWQAQPLQFVKTDFSKKSLAIALMLPADNPMPEVDGEVLDILFKGNGNISIDDFRFENAGLVGADGRINEISMVKSDHEGIQPPGTFALFPAYPNPFNPKTTLRYDLPEKSAITVHLFNIFGRMIRRYRLESQDAGQHEIHWDGTDENGQTASSGTYLVKFVAENRNGIRYTAVQKISLVR
jgi:VWFA-related protein